MRKLISILLIAGLLFVFGAVPAYATMNRFNQDQEIQTYVAVNNTATGTTRIVPSSVIRATYHRIIGYSVTPTQKSTGGGYFGMYDVCENTYIDGTSVTGYIGGDLGRCPVTYLEAELESGGQGATTSEFYAYPRAIKEGIMLQLGEYTTVTIYFERR